MNHAPLTRSERVKGFAAATVFFVLAMPPVADAQGTFLQGLLSLVQGNVITTLGTLAIIVVGLVLMSMRASFVVILMVCAGIWIVFNASTLSSMLQG
ncbi:MAG TPA: TrbC/VirB2 family protein [Acetobacteraceae bacterium]|nr:TrbC/VirB2 family protein [Acetobacteraceae bacterium]